MDVDELRELYQEVILDHGKAPRNNDVNGIDLCSTGYNPMCGDQVKLCIYTDEGKITKIGFDGRGCAISIASASMLTEKVKGMTLEEAGDYAADLLETVTGNKEPDEDQLGELVSLKGVAQFPSRVKCATMVWHCLQDLIQQSGKTTNE